MIASDRARARMACCTIVMAILGVGLACTDFPRINPFDDEATVTLVVSGPDSVTAIGDTVTFEVKSPQGASLDQLSYWSVPDFLRATNVRNKFVVTGLPTSSRAAGTIEVRVNANVATRPVLFAQQARSLSVGACAGEAKVITFTAFLAARDPSLDAAAVCSKLLDRRGHPVPDSSALSGVIRDPGIASFLPSNQQYLNALSVGSTYVVYTRAGFADSLRVDVQQVLAGYQPDPPACLTSPGVVLSPGQTAQLRALPSDAHGNPLVDSVAARAALVGMRWTRGPGLNATLSSSGLVTAVGQSEGWIVAEDRYNQVMFYCYVSVR